MPASEPKRPPSDRELSVRVLRNTAGILLLVAALVGLVLPVLQWLLVLVVAVALIDLPIKARAHRWLLGYPWYRKASSWWTRWTSWWRRDRGGDAG